MFKKLFLKEFLDFVSTLRTNNWQIPVLVGGDFNMDMKSHDMTEHGHLNIVPYRLARLGVT